MRRGDLPLIVCVLALGAGLALFVDPPRPSGGEPPPPPAPVRDFIATLDPQTIECLAAPAPAAGGSEPDDVVEAVTGRVERLRELRFTDDVEAEFLQPEELRDRVQGLVDSELSREEVQAEGELLAALGAIPPDADLYAIVEQALGSQVVGLYDTETEQLLVQQADLDSELPAEEELTLAHELEHALADQALEIPEGPQSPSAADRQLALAAVVEGDATLTMQRYALAYVGFAEELELGESVPGAADEFEALPDYVQRSLLFPYLEGMRLVCHRWVDGGWDAVDALYSKPPTGSDQVLFPSRYGEGAPAAPALGDPGPGWEPLVRRELGAAELEWLLKAPGGDPGAAVPRARARVAGWAGGELALWEDGSMRALAIALAERPGFERTLCAALAAWQRTARPQADARGGEGEIRLELSEPGRVAVLACPPGEARLGVAPDRATALRLARGA